MILKLLNRLLTVCSCISQCAKETALFFCYKAFMRCATPRLPCRAMCDNIQYRWTLLLFFFIWMLFWVLNHLLFCLGFLPRFSCADVILWSCQQSLCLLAIYYPWTVTPLILSTAICQGMVLICFLVWASLSASRWHLTNNLLLDAHLRPWTWFFAFVFHQVCYTRLSSRCHAVNNIVDKYAKELFHTKSTFLGKTNAFSCNSFCILVSRQTLQWRSYSLCTCGFPIHLSLWFAWLSCTNLSTFRSILQIIKTLGICSFSQELRESECSGGHNSALSLPLCISPSSSRHL